MYNTDKVVVKFLNRGTWLDEVCDPSFNVQAGDEREVSRSFAHYICAIGKAKIVYDPQLDSEIPKFPKMSDLHLHSVTLKRLNDHGVTTLDQLCSLKEWEVLKIKGIGMAKLNEIQTQLKKLHKELAKGV